MEKINKCKIYVKCALCSKRLERGEGFFFRVPTNKLDRLRWSLSCDTRFGDTDRICSDHFSPSDIVWNCSKPKLLANAVPLASTQWASDINSNPQEVNTTTAGLINESLFDDKDRTVKPLCNPIDIKTKDDSVMPSFDIPKRSNKTDYDEIIPFSILKEKQRDQEAAIKFPLSKSTQTDEASKNRINCGFVSVSKKGLAKNFNLRCFYCDAEYPISSWSAFSDHIIYKHSDLEHKYKKSDVFTSTTKEQNNNANNINSNNEMDAIDSAAEEQPTVKFINLDDTPTAPIKKSRHNYKCTKIVSEYSDSIDAEYMYVEKYVPSIDHNYTKYGFIEPNNEEPVNGVDPIYEVINTLYHDAIIPQIRIDKTPHIIMCDFLDHFKGYPALWHNRKIDCEKYDKELLNLMNIMKLKWNLNLRMIPLHQDLENIKDWFYSKRSAEIRNGYNDLKHYEYYEKCSEFLLFGNANKYEFECDICNRSVANAIFLQVHKYRKHKIGDLPYRCSKCILRFTNTTNLLTHLKKHLPNPPKKKEEKGLSLSPSQQTFQCFECNQTFPSAIEYKLHLDIHPKGDRPFGCDECGKRYKCVVGLNGHRKRHKSSAYQCEFCPQKLSTPLALKYHINLHKGVYEFVCEYCGRPCVNRNSYNEHIKFSHLGHGVCKICNREYKKRSILNKHLRNLHRPLVGTVEELSTRIRRRSGKRQMNPKYRKFQYIIDPVTQTRRIKCPLCDQSYLRYRNVHIHASKVHNCDLRTIKRPKREKLFKKNNNNSKWRVVKLINDIGPNTSVEEGAVSDVNAHTERSNIKIESPEYSIADDKNVTDTSYENFAGEILPSNQIFFQSTSIMQGTDGRTMEKLVTKVEDYGSSAFSFTLNVIK